MAPQRQCLEVWGSLACFTRPELKVERFSYPVITPSAARAIFDAVYWKPKFQWRIVRIEVLEPVRYIALLRNEVKSKAPAERTIGQWMAGTAEPEPLWAGAGSENGTPRQTMALKDVRYRLHAEIRPWPEFRPELPAMEAQFRRRAAAGQCVYQPYMGCREFPAFFDLGDERGRPALPTDMDIGWMRYDVFDLARPGSSMDEPMITLFRAQARSGVIEVPAFESDAVRKPGEANHA